MLPGVCSALDHRWRQNVNKKTTTKWHTRRYSAFAPPLPTLAKTKFKCIGVAFYLYKMKHLFTMHSKELWLVEKNHATVKPGSSIAPRGMTTKAESWRKCWTNQVSFYHRRRPVSRKARTLHKNCRSWKNTLRKLVVAVNLEAIWLEFWMKGALVTVWIFVFCGWWFFETAFASL